MAKHVLTNAFIQVDGKDISNHCRSITLEDTANEVDLTGFTPSGYSEYGQGLKDATITAEIYQDFASGAIDSVLYPLYDAGGTFAVVVRPNAGTISATNPQYTMTARLMSYSPLSGAVGDANSTDVVFRNAGTAGITRGTAA